MKQYPFLCFVLISNLLNIPLMSNAQSADLQCQKTIDNIKQDILKRGVKQVILYKNAIANKDYRGNPTNRQEVLLFNLASYTKKNGNFIYHEGSDKVVENIMTSPVLNKSWADRIVKDCPTIATFIISQDQTDWSNSFAINPQGKTTQRKCTAEIQQVYSWYEDFCP
jgi:hypothetical protein